MVHKPGDILVDIFNALRCIVQLERVIIMKTLILCDRDSTGDVSSGLCGQVEKTIRQEGCEVQTVILSCDEVKPCLGCFGCWVRTPGLCVNTNDCANDISRRLMQADAVVILSKLTYGGFSPDIKAFLDRSIPNILPFFEVYHGQMHHKMRYERFPYWIAIGYGDSTEDERETFRELVERNALNLRPPKHFCLTIQNVDECPDALRALSKIFTEKVHA